MMLESYELSTVSFSAEPVEFSPRDRVQKTVLFLPRPFVCCVRLSSRQLVPEPPALLERRAGR